MSVKNHSQDTYVRDEIVRIIDILLNQPDQSKEANRLLHSLHQYFLEKEHIFSLDSIVYYPFIQLVGSPEFQKDRTALSVFKDQLLGQIPYWNTYALKYNFVELLQGDAVEAYQKLRQLLTIFTKRLNKLDPIQDISENYEDLLDRLDDLCYKRLHPYTLAEFLVAQGCHILLKLPRGESEYFDTLDVFEGIYPVSTIESVNNHLKFVEDILQKLQGEIVLFIDVHILPNGFVLSSR